MGYDYKLSRKGKKTKLLCSRVQLCTDIVLFVTFNQCYGRGMCQRKILICMTVVSPVNRFSCKQFFRQNNVLRIV